jgi:hypothetical protein
MNADTKTTMVMADFSMAKIDPEEINIWKAWGGFEGRSNCGCHGELHDEILLASKDTTSISKYPSKALPFSTTLTTCSVRAFSHLRPPPTNWRQFRKISFTA